MSGRLQDRVAIITGAGQGIGQAIARRFSEEGAKVVIAELNETTGRAMESELREKGYPALFIRTDVTGLESVRQMVTLALDTYGPPDILVNNAGINVFRDPLELTNTDWKRCFAVDLDGVWYCCQAVLPHMLSNGHGSIINIASVHSFQIIAHCFPYPVAKHGVIGLTRALAIEYASQNIRINAICPGYIETQIAFDYWNTFPNPDEERLRIYRVHPPQRIGSVDEVAWPAVFLASEKEAGFINGASLMVDGGRSILYHE